MLSAPGLAGGGVALAAQGNAGQRHGPRVQQLCHPDIRGLNPSAGLAGAARGPSRCSAEGARPHGCCTRRTGRLRARKRGDQLQRAVRRRIIPPAPRRAAMHTGHALRVQHLAGTLARAPGTAARWRRRCALAAVDCPTVLRSCRPAHAEAVRLASRQDERCGAGGCYLLLRRTASLYLKPRLYLYRHLVGELFTAGLGEGLPSGHARYLSTCAEQPWAPDVFALL